MKRLAAFLFCWVLLIAPASGSLLLLGAGSSGSGGGGGAGVSVLLLPFEGTNGSTGAPMATDQSLSAHGSGGIIGTAPTADTSQKVFGNSSVFFNGGSAQTFSDSPDWVLAPTSTDQYTLEGWVRFTSLGTNSVIICQYASSGTFSRGIQLDATTGTELRYVSSNNGTAFNVDFTTSGLGLTANSWIPWAVDKDGAGKIRLYVNGVMKASNTPVDGHTFDSSQPLAIASTSTGQTPMTGYQDEIRITKGQARYGSDGGYTVTLVPFPN